MILFGYGWENKLCVDGNWFFFLFFYIWCGANLVMVDDCEVYKSDEPNDVECDPIWPSGKALGW